MSYFVNLDNTLPKELRDLFEPLDCKLCTAQLTSTVMAKVHYASNAHEKRLRKWLVEYSERTGEPLHKRATAEPKNKEEEVSSLIRQPFIILYKRVQHNIFKNINCCFHISMSKLLTEFNFIG